MVSDELIANSRSNMIETLLDFASVERQRTYASKVPFVQVPQELACQWEEHSNLIKSQQWFRTSLSEVELNAALMFDTRLKAFMSNFTGGLPDLEVLLNNPLWNQITLDAQATLKAFQL